MHEMITKIGAAVLGFIRNFDGKGLLDALEVMGIGYLGIFIVTGIIIGAVYLLSMLTKEK